MAHRPGPPDAVVHFAAIPRVLLEPDNKTFAASVAITFNVIEAAMKPGVRNVIEPQDCADFPGCLDNPPSRKRNAWSHIDARDLGEIEHLCLQKDGLGFQLSNAVNDTITADLPTAEFLAKYAPHTPATRPMGADEAPLSNGKIRNVLGFREAHPWRAYVQR